MVCVVCSMNFCGFCRCKKNPRLRIAPSLLRRPSGVAVSPWTGHIYVAGTDSHRVYVMDRTGKIIKSLGSPYRSSSSVNLLFTLFDGGTLFGPALGVCFAYFFVRLTV